MTVKVKLHTYLVTEKENETPVLVPAAGKLTAAELKEARKEKYSVYYAGLREYDAVVNGNGMEG